MPVVFGAAVILLLLAAGRGLGWPAAIVAAVLPAISPAMVYYSRYYVQETLLVFFTFGAIVSAWRYARGGSAAWAVAAGLFFGLMYATKETWVLAAAAVVGGLVLVAVWTRILDGRWPHLAAAQGLAVGPGGARGRRNYRRLLLVFRPGLVRTVELRGRVRQLLRPGHRRNA